MCVVCGDVCVMCEDMYDVCICVCVCYVSCMWKVCVCVNCVCVYEQCVCVGVCVYLKEPDSQCRIISSFTSTDGFTCLHIPYDHDIIILTTQ